jgi:uncharacterized protein involved in exopolysaccharide biosynthesis
MDDIPSATDPWRAWLGLFRRHQRKMLLLFVSVMTVVVLVTFLGHKAYRSQAKLFLRLGRENSTLDPTATLGQVPVVAVPQSRESEINSVAEILKSREFVEQIVDEFGPAAILGKEPAADPDPAERDEAVRAAIKLLDVEVAKRSNVVVLTFEASSPELARQVVARHVELFLDRHVHLNRTPGAHAFLATQLDEMRQRLEHKEEELRELKNKTGLVSLDAQRQLLIARIGRLTDELQQTEVGVSASTAEVKSLRDKLSGWTPTHVIGLTKGMPNPGADAMRAQLYTLEMREQELLAKHPDRHPDIQLVRQQTQAARAILGREELSREQVTTGPNRVYEETQVTLVRQEAQLASAQARAGRLHEQLRRANDQLKELNDNALRVAQLQRDVDIQDIEYRKHAPNLVQAQIDAALELNRLSNVSVVQKASLESKPVRPRVLLNLGLGLVFAATGACGLAVLADRRRRTATAKTVQAVAKG